MQYYSDINKCSTCSMSLDNKSFEHINKWHYEIFSSLIGVELRSNSSVSSYICKDCDIKLKKCSDLAQELGNMQKAFNEFLINFETLNDELNDYNVTGQIEEQISETRKLVVRLERLDESVVERYINKTIHFSNGHKNMKSTEIAEDQNVIRKLVVRLEKLDESIIERYRNKTVLSSSENNHVKSKFPYLHLKKKADKSMCVLCDFKSISRTVLLRHQQLKHAFEVPTCRICGNTYDNIFKLKVHIKKVHDKKTEYFCSFCETSYYKYFLFHKHIKISHPKQKHKVLCICDFCGEKYFSKSRLESHMKLMNHFGPFKCFIVKCKKRFSTFATRKKHYLKLHNSDRGELERLHQQEGNLLPFKCENQCCDKRFKGLDYMLKHYEMCLKTLVISLTMRIQILN